MEGSTARGEGEDEEEEEEKKEGDAEDKERFPSLRDWMEGREGLYRDRRDRLQVEVLGVTTRNKVMSNAIIKYCKNKSTFMN